MPGTPLAGKGVGQKKNTRLTRHRGFLCGKPCKQDLAGKYDDGIKSFRNRIGETISVVSVAVALVKPTAITARRGYSTFPNAVSVTHTLPSPAIPPCLVFWYACIAALVGDGSVALGRGLG